MIKWLLRRRIDAFEKAYYYDASYAQSPDRCANERSIPLPLDKERSREHRKRGWRFIDSRKTSLFVILSR